MKEKAIKIIMEMIETFEVANEIKARLNSLEETVIRPEKISNGFEIYYDQISGEAVGIVYQGIVHLKKTSAKKMNWFDAKKYCQTVVINGITSQLFPITDDWKEEFPQVSKGWYDALCEIGADNPDEFTWCSEYSGIIAWYQTFNNGDIYYGNKLNGNLYVRPVLILKK